MSIPIIPNDFFWKNYIKLNSDLSEHSNKEDAIKHYMNHGIFENRKYKIDIPNDFNWKTYLKLNPDLNQDSNEEEANNHYLINGFMENRKYKIDIPNDFDCRNYLKLNPDLIQYDDDEEIIKHYKNYGFFENRKYKIIIPNDFDWKLYIEINKDLNQNSNENESINHYINYGFYENRKYNNKKNIYHMTHNFGGGTSIYVENICKILNNYNHVIISILDKTNVIVDNNLINKTDLDKIITNEHLLIVHHLIFIDDTDDYKIKLCYKTLNFVKKIKMNKIFIVHDYFLFNPEIPNPIKNVKKVIDEQKILEVKNFLSIFDKVFFNSLNCYNNYIKHLTNIDNAHILNVVPDIFYYNKRIFPLKKDKYNIGIIGDISSPHKGMTLSNKIITLFQDCKIKHNFIILGNSPLEKSNLIITRKYKNENIFEMINNYDIDFFIFLSEFEETYSFTLSIAIHTGLPIIYNDIGSYTERLQNYSNCFSFTENNYYSILDILNNIDNDTNLIRTNKKIDINYPNLYNNIPEFSDFVITKFNTDEIEKKLENANVCFINFYNNNCEAIKIFNEQIDYIKKSGLYDKLDFIFVILLGKNIQFNDYKIKLLYYSENNIEYDFSAIELMQNFSNSISKNIKILYIHTKSLMNKNYSYEFRKYIEYFLIEKHDLCLIGLDKYKCVGVNPQFYYDKDNKHKNHFSKNFWWANSNYIKSLPYLENNKNNKYLDYYWLIGDLEKNDYRNFLYLNHSKNNFLDSYSKPEEYNLELIKNSICEKLNTFYIKKRKIFGVYFVCCLGNYLNILNEQINKLLESGLYDITDEIFCFVCLETSDCINLLKNYKKIVIISTKENLFEKYALNNFQKYISGDYYLYYMHTKGITRNTQIYNDWRILCEYITIEKWRVSLEFLEYYDCIGPLLKNFPKKHFSGNFWWTKSEHIDTLKEVNINDGYLSCEMYICSNVKTNYVSFYESNFNISNKNYPASLYNKISDIDLVNNYYIIPDFNYWDKHCIAYCGITDNNELPIIEVE